MVVRRFWLNEDMAAFGMQALVPRFRTLERLFQRDPASFSIDDGSLSFTLPSPTAGPASATAAAAKPQAGADKADAPVWVAPNFFSAAAPLDDEPVLPVAASFLNPIGGGSYMVFYQPDGGLAAGVSLVIDTDKREILTGHEALITDITSGGDDQMVIGGGLEAGTHLGGTAAGVEQLILIGGFDYGLIGNDGDVASGDVLTVIGTSLGSGHHLDFDGSAELDGAFAFLGGAGGDHFTGGAGNDDFHGLGGADVLAGGGGADVFHYGSASESTGAAHDSLVGFDFAADRIDLPGAVTGFDAKVGHGALSTSSFDADLAAAFGSANLGANHAAWFTPDSGDLAGQTFLIVDGNGVAGYQAGQDFVFHMSEPPPPDLSGVGFFV
jgi:Ca2+-binding RTX toxin-like protein